MITDHERECFRVSWESREKVQAWLKSHPEYEYKRPRTVIDEMFDELPEKMEELRKGLGDVYCEGISIS